MDSVIGEIPSGDGFILHRHDDGRIECVLAEPTVWFPQHQLEPKFMPNYLSVEGDLVRLTADNGTWVWRLTERRYVHHYGPGTTPLVLLEARWPD